jgi:hypothetical protein
MARRKKKASAARGVAGLPVIRRPDDVLEPVYEADPDGRPVVHHRTVDTLGLMLRAGTISQEMHDAARDFQAQFTIACYDTLVCMRFQRDSAKGNRAELTETQIDARCPVDAAMDALGGLGSPAGSCTWHVVGLQHSIREWALRQGWGGRPVRVEQAQGILMAALGVLAAHYGYAQSAGGSPKGRVSERSNAPATRHPHAAAYRRPGK